MAASYGAGGQSPPVMGRTVDRVFEDAQFTGEVNLSGRKLKDYPKICTKYDLADTIHTDLSKNRLSEVPSEVCEYSNMERLNCYHNIIKSIPEAIVQLQSLTHLNLSRNQLTVLPVSLCALSSLEVLLASNNKLVSLPEEIGKLEQLMDLDVSCNEISHLPPMIGDLRSLRSLNLRRNLLVELPLDICKLNLRRLDISCNRIQKIPTVFRKLEVLEEIILEHNPLASPSAHLCTRGRQHIMKYLHTEATKEDRKRGVMSDTDMKRILRKSLPLQHPHPSKDRRTSDEFRNILEAPEAKWKRHTVLSSDSGYSTADSLDRNGWHQGEQGIVGEGDENSVLMKAAAEAVQGQRQGHNNNMHIPSDIARARLHPTPASPSLSTRSASPLASSPALNSNSNGGVNAAPDFGQELQRQKQEYEQRKKEAEQIRLVQEEKEKEDRRKMALKIQEEQRAVLDRQREEQQRRQTADRRQQEDQQHKMQEQQRLLDQQARQEEEARLREEEVRAQEEERARLEAKQQEDARKNKTTNKKAKTPTRTTAPNSKASAGNETNSSIFEQPWGPRLHDNYGEYANAYRRRYDDDNDLDNFSGSADTGPPSDYILSEWEYRNALSSQSFKEQRRIANNSQYRRTTSDTTVKRGIPTAVSNNSHGDGHNYSNRNGVAEEDTSPTHSSKPTSPTSANPSLSRLQAGGDRASPAQSPGAGRSKASERSNVPTPTSGRSVSRTSSTSSVNSVQSQGSTGRAPTSTSTNTATNPRAKNHLTPQQEPSPAKSRMYTQPSSTYSRLRPPTSSVHREEEFRQKHQQVKTQHTAESQRLKSRLEDHRPKTNTASTMGVKKPGAAESDNKRQTSSSNARPGATTTGRNARSVLSAGAIKMLEEYKDANPNFTIRRREDQQREENEQLEMLRQTIESRLKVTLPDNLPEALRDGVVLCHLANQIRPRSVASIHVPSPAVPKLTLAKCRRNVENFLDACRKIGVDQEQICVAADIMDERGVQRVAITVAALVAIGTNPRQSAV
ncbi:leucine-rich repeat and calponin homology domain-containing protein 1-like isoform X2 [Littorina saxatilis]|uniref:leucine-rich repeat and calponin homology domain-containing protein 1-like isoform X2 n=1 Tax=Littorina saxatilis TaxID=31220 RepID=UPI0038B4CABB